MEKAEIKEKERLKEEARKVIKHLDFPSLYILYLF